MIRDANRPAKVSPTPRLDAIRKSPVYWMEVASTEFVQGIMAIMDKEGVSGAQLARQYGSSPANISKTLSSGGNYKLKTMVKLANALDAALHVAVIPKGHWFHYQSVPKQKNSLAPGTETAVTGAPEGKATATDHATVVHLEDYRKTPGAAPENTSLLIVVGRDVSVDVGASDCEATDAPQTTEAAIG